MLNKQANKATKTQTYRPIEKKKNPEDPNISTCNFSYLIFNKNSKPYTGEKLFSTNRAGEAGYPHAEKRSCTKTNFKWIKNLSVKHWAARRKCHIEEPCIVQNLLTPLAKN